MNINIDITGTVDSITCGGVEYIPAGSVPPEPPASVGFVSRCSVQKSGNQSIPHNIWTKAVLDAVNYDDNNEFTDSKFVVKEAGYYSISWSIGMLFLNADKSYDAAIYKNGVQLRRTGNNISTQVHPHVAASVDLDDACQFHLCITTFSD